MKWIPALFLLSTCASAPEDPLPEGVFVVEPGTELKWEGGYTIKPMPYDGMALTGNCWTTLLACRCIPCNTTICSKTVCDEDGENCKEERVVHKPPPLEERVCLEGEGWSITYP